MAVLAVVLTSGCAPALAATYDFDLGWKTLAFTNRPALGELATIELRGIGESEATNLTMYLSNAAGNMLAVTEGMTATGTAARGELALNSTNLLEEFDGVTTSGSRMLEFSVWDAGRSVLLVSAPIEIRNNPLWETLVFTNLPDLETLGLAEYLLRTTELTSNSVVSARYVLDLGWKDLEFENSMALAERAIVEIRGIGAAEPSGMMMYLSDSDQNGLALAPAMIAGTNSDTAVGLLNLATTNLLDAFEGMSPQAEKTFDLTIWDSGRDVMLGSAPVVIRNNPLAKQFVEGWTNLPGVVTNEVLAGLAAAVATANAALADAESASAGVADLEMWQAAVTGDLAGIHAELNILGTNSVTPGEMDLALVAALLDYVPLDDPADMWLFQTNGEGVTYLGHASGRMINFEDGEVIGEWSFTGTNNFAGLLVQGNTVLTNEHDAVALLAIADWTTRVGMVEADLAGLPDIPLEGEYTTPADLAAAISALGYIPTNPATMTDLDDAIAELTGLIPTGTVSQADLENYIPAEYGMSQGGADNYVYFDRTNGFGVIGGWGRYIGFEDGWITGGFSWSGTQSFYSVSLGGVERTSWPEASETNGFLIAADLEDRIGPVEDNVQVLSGLVVSATAQVAALSGDLAAMGSTVTGVVAQAASNQTDIATLQTGKLDADDYVAPEDYVQTIYDGGNRYAYVGTNDERGILSLLNRAYGSYFYLWATDDWLIQGQAGTNNPVNLWSLDPTSTNGPMWMGIVSAAETIRIGKLAEGDTNRTWAGTINTTETARLLGLARSGVGQLASNQTWAGTNVFSGAVSLGGVVRTNWPDSGSSTSNYTNSVVVTNPESSDEYVEYGHTAISGWGRVIEWDSGVISGFDIEATGLVDHVARSWTNYAAGSATLNNTILDIGSTNDGVIGLFDAAENSHYRMGMGDGYVWGAYEDDTNNMFYNRYLWEVSPTGAPACWSGTINDGEVERIGTLNATNSIPVSGEWVDYSEVSGFSRLESEQGPKISLVNAKMEGGPWYFPDGILSGADTNQVMVNIGPTNSLGLHLWLLGADGVEQIFSGESGFGFSLVDGLAYGSWGFPDGIAVGTNPPITNWPWVVNDAAYSNSTGYSTPYIVTAATNIVLNPSNGWQQAVCIPAGMVVTQLTILSDADSNRISRLEFTIYSTNAVYITNPVIASGTWSSNAPNCIYYYKPMWATTYTARIL